MIELERTFLVKRLPKGMGNGKQMLDIYIPKECHHPSLRIRKNGDTYEITKKEPEANDPSRQIEQTVVIREDEFIELANSLEGKRVEKTRYVLKDIRCEIDVFQGGLKGLVMADFEFDTEKDKREFKMPEFCLTEVTDQQFLAGGMLCGKSYEDIAKRLEELGYKRLTGLM